MKIYGNGFTMIDSNEYDLIQMINEIDMNRIDTPMAQIERRHQAMKTFVIGAGLLAAQIVIGSLLKKTNAK